MVLEHKIQKIIDSKKFHSLVCNFKDDNIITTHHTYFRLAERQRKVFKDSLLREYIKTKVPILVGIQYNECHAVYYDFNEKETLKLILSIQQNKINIITFIITDKKQIPRIGK